MVKYNIGMDPYRIGYVDITPIYRNLEIEPDQIHLDPDVVNLVQKVCDQRYHGVSSAEILVHLVGVHFDEHYDLDDAIGCIKYDPRTNSAYLFLGC
jgi:hypothetical protein